MTATDHSPSGLEALLAEIRACRACVAPSVSRPLPHEPRPVLRAAKTARIAVVGQAPGVRVNRSGVPFSDPSGVRLRAWLGVTEAEFYDEGRIAVVPMAFCFPGHDANGGDLPPRPLCAQLWRERVFQELDSLELILLVGSYAHAWHLKEDNRKGARDTIRAWRAVWNRPGLPKMMPLPHPSWRNNAWLKNNSWFEREVLPVMREAVRQCLSGIRLQVSGATSPVSEYDT